MHSLQAFNCSQMYSIWFCVSPNLIGELITNTVYRYKWYFIEHCKTYKKKYPNFTYHLCPMLTMEWYSVHRTNIITMLAQPKTNTIPAKAIPTYANISKWASILLKSVKTSKEGVCRNVFQLGPPKWWLTFLRYRSVGSNPSLPRSCLFWCAAIAKATTAK